MGQFLLDVELISKVPSVGIKKYASRSGPLENLKKTNASSARTTRPTEEAQSLTFRTCADSLDLT